MDWVKPFAITTLWVVAIGLVLRNPSGTKSAGQSLGTLYSDVVGSFIKPS